MTKKFKVTFYTNVVYPTADDVSQDQFTRYYELPDNSTIDDVVPLVEELLESKTFLRDEDSKTA